MNFTRRFKTCAFSAPRIVALTDQFRIQSNGFGYAIQRQIPGNSQFITVFLNFRGGEGGLWEFCDVEELCAAQVFIALSMVRVDAVRINGHIDFICRRIFLVKSKCAVEIFKGAVQPAVSQVLNAEIDESVLALFINFIVSRYGRTGGESQRTEGNTQQVFFHFMLQSPLTSGQACA